MPSPRRILSLNLGSQSLGLAEFRAQPGGGLVLHGFRLREILGETGTEAARHAQITATLREMLADLQIKEGRVNYAIANQSVFARFVKLPSVEEEKIERIIQFEAQQNVPFPIDEVVWDYQVVGGGVEEEVEVVLVAVKSDLLEAINAAVESAGLKTALVDVATMALYNAFRYNYPDLGGCSLLVGIGARTTNLLFIEPGRVFSRSIPIGGNSISAAIAKELGEPFSAAENRKKRENLASLSGAGTPDPDLARVSEAVRGTMTRLYAEVMRSVSHYRTQQQGSQPERVFLAGGSTTAPFVHEFFREKLQLPIEFFNPLRHVPVASSKVADQTSNSAHLLGELVGLALRSAASCPMELNLAPASVERAQALARRRPFLILAAACFLFGLLGWSAYYWRAARLEREVNERLQERVNGMRMIEARMEKVRRTTKALESEAAPLVATIRARSFWPQILEELNARLPKQDIWITELAATSAGKPIGVSAADRVTDSAFEATGALPLRSGQKMPNESMIDGVFVRGLYLFNPKQQEVVVDYFRNLAGAPHFKVDPNNQARVLKPTMPNNTEWAFPYELRLELRNGIQVP